MLVSRKFEKKWKFIGIFVENFMKAFRKKFDKKKIEEYFTKKSEVSSIDISIDFLLKMKKNIYRCLLS